MNTLAEPAWLAGMREAARAVYDSLPVPSNREEAWRFTNLRGFDPDGTRWSSRSSISRATPPRRRPSCTCPRRWPSSPRWLSRTWHRWCPTARSSPPANAAHWLDGVLLHVPAGVEIEAPLRAIVDVTADGTRRLPPRADRARARREGHLRGGVPLDTAPAYVNTVVEMIVGDDAQLEYVTVQEHHSETRQFGTHRVTVGRDAKLDWVAAAVGGTRAKSRMESYLAGQGAQVKVTGAYYLTGREHIDFDTTQEHAAPDTFSDLAFKGVLDDRARAVWRGVIRVDKGAQKTDAYQENRNLLLSSDAQATPIPGLEIEANDVRCTHGATVGQVDRGQMFYLMARGLTHAEAERLIVRGFFEDVLERIGSQEVRDRVTDAIEARLPA